MTDRYYRSHARRSTTRGQVGRLLFISGRPRNALVEFDGRLVVLPFRCLRKVGENQ